MSSTHATVSVEFEGSEPGTYELEGMWAKPVDGGYELDNIPFYAYELALGDVVAVEPDSDGLLRYRSLVKASGHSTVRLWFSEEGEKDITRVRDELRAMGCKSEKSHLRRLIAVDVPREVEYDDVRKYLDACETEGILGYEEACLGFKGAE